MRRRRRRHLVFALVESLGRWSNKKPSYTENRADPACRSSGPLTMASWEQPGQSGGPQLLGREGHMRQSFGRSRGAVIASLNTGTKRFSLENPKIVQFS